MDKYIIIIFINCLLSQATFQTLELPQDSQSLAMSGASGAFSSEQFSSNPSTIMSQSNLKGLTSIYYPGNILFLNTFFNKRYQSGVLQFSASNLYFGRLFDQETQHEFYANDFLFNVVYKNIYKKKLSYGVAIKYLYSDIDIYSAHVLAGSIGGRLKILEKKLGLSTSLENFGIVASEYTESYHNTLPTKARFAGHYKLKYLPAYLFMDYLYSFNTSENTSIYGIKFAPNEQILIILSSSSNKNDLKVNSLYQDIIAGIAMGIRINLANQFITISWKSLGPAGNCIGVGVTF